MTKDNLPEHVVVYESDDWAALYVDGVLDRVGDAYLADERIREIFGVETVHSSAYFIGEGKTRADVAKTLPEVQAEELRRAENRRRAAALREEAAALEFEAAALDKRS